MKSFLGLVRRAWYTNCMHYQNCLRRLELRSNSSWHQHMNTTMNNSLYMYITDVTDPRTCARIDVTRYVNLVETCQGIFMIILHWAVTSHHPFPPPRFFCLPFQHSTHQLFHTALYTGHIARERDISQYTSYKFSRSSKSFFTMKIGFSISKRHIVH